MAFWFGKKKSETGKVAATPTVAAPEQSSAEVAKAPVKTVAAVSSSTAKVSAAANIDGLILPADVALPAARNAVAASSGVLSSSATNGISRPASETSSIKKTTTSIIRPQQSQKVLYYQLMNGLYDAILIMGDQGHVIDCNERVTPTLGYAREEMWDKHISEFVKGISPKIFSEMKEALSNNRQVLITAHCMRKDGTSFMGEVGVSIMNLNGHNLVFSIRNIEKRLAKMRIKPVASHQ